MNSIDTFSKSTQFPVVDPLTNITPLQQTAEALVTAGKIAILIVVAVKGGLFASAAALILMSATTVAFNALKGRFKAKTVVSINQFPNELMGEILLKLSLRELAIMSQVSSRWNDVSLKVSKQEYLQLQFFLIEIIKDAELSHIEYKIMKIEDFDALNLLEIQSGNADLFNNIILTVQLLKVETLEKYIAMGIDENIFLIAKLLKQFDPLFFKEDKFDEAQSSILKLISRGYLDKIIQCGDQITYGLKDSFFKLILVHLRSFCESSSKLNKYDRVEDLANLMQPDFVVIRELYIFSTLMFKDGYEDKALNLTSKILKLIKKSNNTRCEDILFSIPGELLFHKCNLNNILEIVNTIPSLTDELVPVMQTVVNNFNTVIFDYFGSKSFKVEALHLMNSGFYLMAIHFANKIEAEDERIPVLKRISLELSKYGKFDGVIKLVDVLPLRDNQRLWAFYSTYEYIARNKKL